MGQALRIIQHLTTYRRNGSLSREALHQLQLREFRAIVRHAMDHTQFYAHLYRGLDPDRVVPRDLPVVTKNDLREHFHEFLTDESLRLDDLRPWVNDPANIGRYYDDKYVVFHTSGTTGPSTVIVYDRQAFEKIKAVGMVRGFDRPASPWTALKVALDPVKPRMAIVLVDGGLYPAVTNFLYVPRSARLFFQIQVFSLFTPIPDLVEQLNEYQPWFLFGYPSVIAALAHEQKAGRLHILEGPPRRGISTMSEPLLPQVRRIVEEVWGLPVVDTYGTGECLALCRGCSSHGHLHVNDDMALMEVVDADHQPVAPGTQGTSILVTNLFNRAQPFIRFQVSDMVTVSPEPCPCGSPLTYVQSVQGRTEEHIWLVDPQGTRELLHPYLFVVAMFRVPAVKEYQVIQRDGVTLEVHVEGTGDEPLDVGLVATEVQRELDRARLRTPLTLRFERVDRIGPDPATGKVRRVIPHPG